MKQTKGWHFTNGNLLRDGRPIPPVGEWLRHKGELEICKSGLHYSTRIIDALEYAPGCTLHRVTVWGGRWEVDKGVARARRIDASAEMTWPLVYFAEACAARAAAAEAAAAEAAEAWAAEAWAAARGAAAEAWAAARGAETEAAAAEAWAAEAAAAAAEAAAAAAWAAEAEAAAAEAWAAEAWAAEAEAWAAEIEWQESTLLLWWECMTTKEEAR